MKVVGATSPHHKRQVYMKRYWPYRHTGMCERKRFSAFFRFIPVNERNRTNTKKGSVIRRKTGS